MRIMVTGGAGFIGFALVQYLLNDAGDEVLNLDKLTYASDREAAELRHPAYRFHCADICEREAVGELFNLFKPEAILHLAAESHVDRSIDGPGEFLRTNVLGTVSMLEAALSYWQQLDGKERTQFRFHHVSTDEVYGDLGNSMPPATEEAAFRPSSPYSASKAASDHFVRAWRRTYELPTLVSNCSNNYGPRQFPEKLIPLTIISALEGKPLPIYGDGFQVRDWIHVDDHVQALRLVLARGSPGETYNIGGASERRNIDVVRLICELLEEMRPGKPAGVARYEQLISFVPDRPGHDRRYAIDGGKIASELGWAPRETFESGLRRTVRWYLDNPGWSEAIRRGGYEGQRLGLATAGSLRDVAR